MTKAKENWPYQEIAKKVILGVIGIWGASALMIVIGAGSDADAMGLAGDGFGAINSLFSGLAFAGLIYAIFLQRDELRAQREELEMTREELKGQKAALQAQNETMNRQRFENTFFQMLSLFNQIADSTTWRGDDRYKGSTAFSKIYAEGLRQSYHNRLSGVSVNIGEPLEVSRAMMDAYANFLRANESIMGPYIRTFKAIFDFINSSDITNQDFYANLAKAQLSEHESLLLFYHVGYSPEEMVFESLVKKFNIFENISSDNEFLAGVLDKMKLQSFKTK